VFPSTEGIRLGGDLAGKTLQQTPLDRTARDILRSEARDLWFNETGRRAIWDNMDVHHRIPLEWSHLFQASPNRLSNLVGINSAIHNQQITPLWNAWRQSLGGRTPTATEVMRFAFEIDKKFASHMKFVR
jgi:hypothetical protein